jgi:cation/acetate symporter
MSIAFVGIWLFSVLDRSVRSREDRAGFDAQYVRCQTGIGASSAASH